MSRGFDRPGPGRRGLLGGLAVAALATSLILVPAAPAAATPEPELSTTTEQVQAELAAAELLGQAELAGAPALTAQASRGAGAGLDASGGPSIIVCVIVAGTPHTADFSPFEIQGSAAVACSWWMRNITIEVSLFRNGSEVSSRIGTAIFTDLHRVDTFGPCVGGAYFTTGVATVFFPPGYSPSVGVISDVSGVAAINAAGTAVPPFICQHPPEDDPPDDPPEDPPEDPPDLPPPPPTCPRCQIP